jgi:beta-mannan synthase
MRRGHGFVVVLQCLNEVPATYEAYRKQQHRWSCGPMQLWRKATSTVWASNVTLCHKLYVPHTHPPPHQVAPTTR